MIVDKDNAIAIWIIQLIQSDWLTLAVMLVWLILICVDFLNMWFIWLTVALVLFYVELNSEIRPRLRPDLLS